ncbi:hypothetical protein ES332_D12G050800v1 [Gossypium tomentosum]|nr:hypothetical protein ES332_D12G050800v1 [Gossypium tomentosum]
MFIMCEEFETSLVLNESSLSTCKLFWATASLSATMLSTFIACPISISPPVPGLHWRLIFPLQKPKRPPPAPNNIQVPGSCNNNIKFLNALKIKRKKKLK